MFVSLRNVFHNFHYLIPWGSQEKYDEQGHLPLEPQDAQREWPNIAYYRCHCHRSAVSATAFLTSLDNLQSSAIQQTRESQFRNFSPEETDCFYERVPPTCSVFTIYILWTQIHMFWSSSCLLLFFFMSFVLANVGRNSREWKCKQTF